jgi:hypothetical protein
MKFWDIEQNTDEWYNARAGIPTASQFSRIVTKTGRLSEQATKYAYECVAEIYMQHPIERNFIVPRPMEWGHDYENEALLSYELLTNLNCKSGGFFTDNNFMYGASPDVRIYENDTLVGVAEIKCPQVPKHIEFVLMEGKINPEYIPQVQGHMLVTGCEWVDWFSYHPDLPHALVRTYRDEKFIELLKEQLFEFNNKIEAGMQILRNRGFNFDKPIKAIEAKNGSFKRTIEPKPVITEADKALNDALFTQGE